MHSGRLGAGNGERLQGQHEPIPGTVNVHIERQRHMLAGHRGDAQPCAAAGGVAIRHRDRLAGIHMAGHQAERQRRLGCPEAAVGAGRHDRFHFEAGVFVAGRDGDVALGGGVIGLERAIQRIEMTRHPHTAARRHAAGAGGPSLADGRQRAGDKRAGGRAQLPQRFGLLVAQLVFAHPSVQLGAGRQRRGAHGRHHHETPRSRGPRRARQSGQRMGVHPIRQRLGAGRDRGGGGWGFRDRALQRLHLGAQRCRQRIAGGRRGAKREHQRQRGRHLGRPRGADRRGGRPGRLHCATHRG